MRVPDVGTQLNVQHSLKAGQGRLSRKVMIVWVAVAVVLVVPLVVAVLLSR